MRDDYKIKGPTAKLEVEIESTILEKISAMEKASRLSVSEMTNTALKRFIATHKDFLPKDFQPS